MRITCPKCGHSAEVNDAIIPAGTTSIRCNACSTKFPLSRDSGEPVENLQGGSFCCPVCKTEQKQGDVCRECGLIFDKYLSEKAKPHPTAAGQKPSERSMTGGDLKGRHINKTRTFSAFKIPLLSFYSKSMYRDACFCWKGSGFAYLFLLLAVCWMPSLVKFHLMISKSIRKDLAPIISQIPQITITNGMASVDVPQPYTIKSPETKKAIFVIDTTGKINTLKEADARGLITKKEIIIQKNDLETRSFSFKSIDHLIVNQQKVAGWSEMARKYSAITFYPFAVAGSFVFRIIQMLLYAVIGLMFASWCRSKISYDCLLRLSIVAVTPCIIINTILGVAGVTVPFAGLWSFLITMLYLFIGVKESAKHARQADNPAC
jgi:predicted Zn finger-like uncharacterized protein